MNDVYIIDLLSMVHQLYYYGNRVCTAEKGWLFQPEYGYLSCKLIEQFYQLLSHCSLLYFHICMLYSMECVKCLQSDSVTTCT